MNAFLRANLLRAQGKPFPCVPCEAGLYALNLLVLVSLSLCIRRFVPSKWRRAASLALPALQLAALCTVQPLCVRTGPLPFYLLSSILFAASLTAQVHLWRLLPFAPEDDCLFFSLLLTPQFFFCGSTAALGVFVYFFLIILALFAVGCLQADGHWRRELVGSFQYAWLCLAAFWIRAALRPAVRLLSSWWPAGGGALALACVHAPLLFAAALLGERFAPALIRFNRIAREYSMAGTHFLRTSLLITLFFASIFLLLLSARALNTVIRYALPLLCLRSFALHMLSIVLFCRALLSKKAAACRAWEQSERTAYYEKLEQSLTAMQQMRHDIKNVFITMGNFVDRSNDEEMKAFFWEKINPYAGGVIHRNELFTRLHSVPCEPLRAFLYAKAEQAAQQHVPLRMDVRVVPEQFVMGMDILDLTRVLGILLDNAIEEAAQLPGGQVEVVLSTAPGKVSYRISNAITEETRRRGVIPGQSTKGPARGKGLVIVAKLLEPYQNVMLSSLLLSDTFVQTLSVEEDARAF